MSNVTGFLPCRKGSERVPNKNTRDFANVHGGLVSIKIRQLIKCDDVTNIVVSTDDPIVDDIVSKMSKETDKPIHIYERPAHLATSESSTDDVIAHVPELIAEGDVLWTHVTSPFVSHALYSKAIYDYKKSRLMGMNDSLMSVTNLQTFVWNEAGPMNYNREVEKWPRTQTLPNLYEVNSAIFIAPIEVYREQGDRVGKKPLLFTLTFPALVDIDTLSHFNLAESIWNSICDE
jgi:CMP-N-acetylneuraminic acid synthetase